MDAFLQFVGTTGLSTSFIGLLLFVYFAVRKQEATVRTDQIETIERLKADIQELDAARDKAIALVDTLRDESFVHQREVSRLTAKLYKLGSDES